MTGHPLRIGLVSPYSLSQPGGVQGQVLGLAHALRALGHSVRVLAPCDGPPPELGVTPLGRAIPLATNGSVAPLAPDAPAQMRLLRALWAESFDVVHVHEPLAPGVSVTAMLVKSAPLVGTFHASGDFSAYSWLKPLCRWGLSHLDVAVAVSPDAEKTARSFYEGECHILFNGVETDRFESIDPWPTTRPALLFVGRHEERKGLAVFLDACSRLSNDVDIWVAGDGPLTAELKKRHADDDRIHWLGRVDDTERDRRLMAATVLCAPALSGESFGVVLLEGMAAGTCVVASDIDGYTNVATNGLDAVLVPPGDAEALADALRAVLADPALRERLCAEGATRADEFSMAHLAELYDGLYRDAIAVHRHH